MIAIETKNLKLVQCDVETLKAAISGNENLGRKLGVEVIDHWTEFGLGALQYSLDHLSRNQDESGWWTYLPIHKHDNKLIGSGGYRGKPTSEGTVEIGYEIASNYRNRGLASEMTMGLIQNAFNNHKVNAIIAHTLGKVNPSTTVLTKCGFEKIDEINDPEEGKIWKWMLRRNGPDRKVIGDPIVKHD